MAELIADRYEVRSYLGRGGMGEVFLARDTLLKRQVAIKRIRMTHGFGDVRSAVLRLRREAQAAAVVQHPNVVTVHDLLTVGHDLYIVMEYVDGHSLDDLIRNQGRLDPGVVARIGAQVAAALEAAHRVGVIHRDVKPANILVDASGTTKLADFGIARTVGDTTLTGTGQLIGSVTFMAPEVANGGSATFAADVYSLGASLFAATEGHAPFAKAADVSSPGQVVARLVREAAPPARHAGPLAEVIARMLAKDPAVRPKAAQARLLIEAHDSFVTSSPWRSPQQYALPDLPTIRSTALDSTLQDTLLLGAEGDSPPSASTETTRPPLFESAHEPAEVTMNTIAPSLEVPDGDAAHDGPATAHSARHPVPRNQSLHRTPLRRRLSWGLGAAGLTAVIAMAAFLNLPSPTSPNFGAPTTVNPTSSVTVRPVTEVVATLPVGKNPGSPMVAPDGTVYVTSFDEGTLSAIRHDRILSTMRVGDQPALRLMAPDGTLYVSSDTPRGRTLSAFTAGRPLGTEEISFGQLEVQGEPSLVASAAGTVYMTSYAGGGERGGTVEVIEHGKVTDSLRVGRNPLIDADAQPVVGSGDTLYVPNSADGTVSVIRNRRVTATIPVGNKPLTPAVTLDGTVYVPNNDDGTVSVINGDSVSATIPVGHYPRYATATDNGSVYVSNAGDGTVSVIRAGLVEDTINVGQEAWLVAAPGDIIYAPSSDGTVTVLDQGKVTATHSLEVGQLTTGPDGTAYMTQMEAGNLVVMQGDRIDTIPVGGRPAWPVVDREGTVYVTDTANGTLIVLR